jgi:hypothetical protein
MGDCVKKEMTLLRKERKEERKIETSMRKQETKGHTKKSRSLIHKAHLRLKTYSEYRPSRDFEWSICARK